MITVLVGDALEKLKELPDESVHCVVTSPPYWGLRDYSRCSCSIQRFYSESMRVYGGADREMGNGGNQSSDDPRCAKIPDPRCPICHGTGIIEGVKEYQLGLEKTPEEYVNHLVEVFREVRRVLRGDGTLWLNLGDSYCGNVPRASNGGRAGYGTPREGIINRVPDGLKSKDLVGIPWRVAFALQADGWYLRSDIIWNKPNPMPESVRDRPTKSHEYIFLLTKSARYFFDQEAVREAVKPESVERYEYAFGGKKNEELKQGDNPRAVVGNRVLSTGRNIRTVWEITTKPYPEAHFATFPEELPRRCIKAGTSEKGCCPKCGAPWERATEQNVIARRKPEGGIRANTPELGQNRANSLRAGFRTLEIRTIGWQPTCSCGIEETIPCTVLDPFAGSGTTGAVARSLGRKAILIELNPEYVKLIDSRADASVPDIMEFGEAGKVV